MAVSKPIRLQKYLAARGIASRRGAEELIKAGRVSVDGETVTEMGIKVDPACQTIRFDGTVISPQRQKPVYILLNKPKGYVTTLADPQGRPIVTSLLKKVAERVFPVGRLDIDTEGALLLTNDGDLAHRVLHPSHETTKTYETLVRGIPSRAALARLEAGIILEGRQTSPAKVTVLKRNRQSCLLKVIIHEGRKRQVRKMLQAINHPVIELKRVAYGKLSLGELKSGSYRFLSQKELKKIFL